MAKPSTLLVTRSLLSMPILTGQDAIWQIIRQLDKKGPWSIADIDGETHVAVITTIEDYVRRLRAGGYVDVVGERDHGQHNTPAKLHRVKIKSAEAPRLRRDGSKAPPSAQAHMWRTMRSLRQGFTHAELAYYASTDDLAIKPITAKSYVQRLADAGFLQLIEPAKNSGGFAIWRLKPSMNTGPLAPQVLRTRFIFDPNRKAIVGEPSVAENEEAIQ